jgi:hypothetical protein
MHFCAERLIEYCDTAVSAGANAPAMKLVHTIYSSPYLWREYAPLKRRIYFYETTWRYIPEGCSFPVYSSLYETDELVGQTDLSTQLLTFPDSVTKGVDR